MLGGGHDREACQVGLGRFESLIPLRRADRTDRADERDEVDSGGSEAVGPAAPVAVDPDAGIAGVPREPALAHVTRWDASFPSGLLEHLETTYLAHYPAASRRRAQWRIPRERL